MMLMAIITPFTFLHAQQPIITPEEPEYIQQAIEQQAETQEEEIDFTDILVELEYLLQNPIQINTATFDEVKQLFFLNEIQITNLLEYRNLYGAILSVYELAYIDGFDRDVIAMVEPFLAFGKNLPARPLTTRALLRYGTNQLFVRYQQVIEQQKGFLPISDSLLSLNPNQRYLGSPFRLHLRYSFNNKNRIRWGFTAEKDPGEEFFRGNQPYGFDFYSGYFYYKSNKWLRDVALGDFHLQIGQGLTLWTTPAFGKTADVSGIRKISRGIKPSTSVNENQFLRGGAFTIGIKRLTLTTFGSYKNIDATVRQTDTMDSDYFEVSALQVSGYHRTHSELLNRRSLSESVFGGRVQWVGSRLQVGGTYYQMHFSQNINPRQQLYNYYTFRGKTNQVIGADWLYLFRKSQLFGEVARSHSGGLGILAGATANPSLRLTLSAVYRCFDRNFHNFYAAPMAESSFGSGEEGFYLGTIFLASPRLTFKGYADFFRFSWLRYRVDAPSRGQEYSGELDYRISRLASVAVRYRSKQRESNLALTDKFNAILPVQRQNLRIHFQYQPLKTLTLRNRMEWIWNTSNASVSKQGYLMYQDVIWKPQSALSFTARYAIFDTDTYDERIYAYENDVLYAFSVPAYYYKGSRAYLLVRWQTLRNLDAWLKISQTWYSNRTIIGSGLDEITGNTKSEVKLQLRYKF